MLPAVRKHILQSKPKTVVAIILLSLLAGAITWLLVARLTINVDTRRHDYSLRWQGIGSVILTTVANEVVIRARIFFWQFDFYALRTPKMPARKPRKPKPQKQRRSKFFTWRKMRRVVQSFRVRRFHLDLDTDDYVLNAYLYPLFYFASGPNRQLNVNFQGETNLVLQIENRLFRIIRAILF